MRSGEIRLDKFYALLDCGTPVNPELALGQIYGASMRAIGHSMTEEIIYDSKARRSLVICKAIARRRLVISRWTSRRSGAGATIG
ncbi:Carbon monoxide dehydrogenase large chain [Serratia fonticola]|uniref:Carbon monoxide dehydrogenase large chain n=1 Tax=Serratia fonticola TaxID=47917 RepID=A0A4U9UE98_SERFO|nr:Carbon monoxide dehydrogenase large chain [Serratia fonticola]